MTVNPIEIALYYADDMRKVGQFGAPDAPDLTHSLAWQGIVEATPHRLADADHAALEQAWVLFNRGSGCEHPELDGRKLRSLSVGDVVKIIDPGNARFYRCEAAGWKRVEGVRTRVPR